MGSGKKLSEASSDRAKWDALYAGLVKLIKKQQSQLETLLSQREFLEDRLNKQHDTFVSNLRVYEHHFSQLKARLEEKEMEILMEAAKSELLVGLKQREAVVHKLKLEETEDELADFRALFEYLSTSLKKTEEPDEGNEGSRRRTRSSSGTKTTNTELERLKLKCEKLASEKDEISKEKSFVWNQFNRSEAELTKKIKEKQDEVDQTKEKIAHVVTTVEQLQSSNNEKDETIVNLRTRVSEMEEESNRWQEKASKLSEELEALKKSQGVAATPVLRSCKEVATASTSSRPKTSGKENGKEGKRLGGCSITVKKEESSSAENPRQNSKSSRRRSKRKGSSDDDGVIILESPPKLFTSTFRVPKLKISSSTPV
ncbi:hypothetical protein LINPERPRIM_LOCUS29531 [Linum perenne]